MSVKDDFRHAAYVKQKLLTDLTDEQRAFWREKLAFYQRKLAGRCLRCGRQLTDEESIRRGFGSECVQHVDPREALSWVEERDEDADRGMYDPDAA